MSESNASTSTESGEGNAAAEGAGTQTQSTSAASGTQNASNNSAEEKQQERTFTQAEVNRFLKKETDKLEKRMKLDESERGTRFGRCRSRISRCRCVAIRIVIWISDNKNEHLVRCSNYV
ncbi:MAG: hypothetical protein ACK5NT_07855 [Pyrinomonadaceae bacterium]